jgi:RNA polymerase sigma-70 factor, ECF subfamily
VVSPEEREELEREVRRRAEQGDIDGAATCAIRGYGREIFSFLMALHRDEEDASEVFSMFTEGLWRALPGFAWQSSLRTWAYEVARRSSLRHRRDARRRAAKIALYPDGSALSQISERVRTETLAFLRTEPRNRISELRESLPEEDRALLLLRVDRKLAWNDLAVVMHEGENEPLEGDALKKEAARLRKRFQLIKDKLEDLARKEGLLPPKQGRG